MSKLLNPTGQTVPYYTKNVNAADGAWTAKFVFVAPNAWTDAQGTWLEAELAKPTTYTFIVRHEPWTPRRRRGSSVGRHHREVPAHADDRQPRTPTSAPANR
ncbi:MAG: hypothetical protein U0263_40905 [Polyangiaceae bacterium]